MLSSTQFEGFHSIFGHFDLVLMCFLGLDLEIARP